MKVKDYLSRLNATQGVTFIKARARKDAATPYYHAEYQTTPARCVWEWKEGNAEKLMESVILNDRQMPIDWLSGATWEMSIKNGWLKCLLVIHPEDLYLLYSKEQAAEIEKYIEGKLMVS